MNKKNIKLIVGLGNPGSEFEFTRHNLGFLTIDKLQEKIGFPEFKKSDRFKAFLSQKKTELEKITLLKPTTFMNSSGEAVQSISSFYKIKPEEILVIQDDLDLELGKIREKFSSSSGGHKGIQSIINSLNTNQFFRIKVGISPNEPNRIEVKDFVLQKFTQSELKTIQAAIETTVALIEKNYLK
jgi:PTH1 family peptidyl-tRNA hydrolase